MFFLNDGKILLDYIDHIPEEFLPDSKFMHNF